MSGNVKRVTRQYTEEYKAESVKLVKEIGITKAAKELGIPKTTLFQWVKQYRAPYYDDSVFQN